MAGGSKNTGSSTSWTSMPLVNDILPWAKGVVTNSGPGGAWQPNTTSQVTPFSKQTMTGLTGLENVAKQSYDPLKQNFDRVNTTLKDGGLNNLQDQQVKRFQGIANSNGLNSIQQGALNLLNPIAQGKEMQNNPYLQGVIDRGSQDIANSANLMASGAGRYGSDSHAQVLGKNIGDFASNLRFNDYTNQLGRRDSAIQNVANLGGAGQSNVNNAISSLFNAGSTQRQNLLNGTQQLQDAYKLRQSPMQDLLGVGGAYENKNTQLLQDQSRIFNEKKNQQTAPLNWLADLASRFQGGSTTTNYQQPSNPLGGGLGGFLSGYGLTGSPLGGLFGGLGGAFLAPQML